MPVLKGLKAIDLLCTPCVEGRHEDCEGWEEPFCDCPCALFLAFDAYWQTSPVVDNDSHYDTARKAWFAAQHLTDPESWLK